MPADSLTTFLKQLDSVGELVRISQPVESQYEIAEITRQAVSQNGDSPALMFDQVRGHTIPVVTNLFGATRRICMAFEAETLDEIPARLKQIIMPAGADNFLDGLQLLPQLVSLKRSATKAIKQGLCQQVVRVGRDVDLSLLPVPHFWSSDSGRVVSRGQVVFRSTNGDVFNVRMLPVEIVDRDKAIIHWDEHDELQQLWLSCEERRTQFHAAVVLGGSPLLDLFSQMPLPEYANPLSLAALFHNQPIEITPARSVEVSVPANAEIVLEGILDPQTEKMTAGHITMPTGFASQSSSRPVMQITAATQQTNPVFPTLVHHAPPSEATAISQLWERFLEQFAKLYLPEITAIRLPASGAGRNQLFVSIKKRYANQAKKVCSAIWGLLWPNAAKMIVVVDEDCDLSNELDVWFRVGSHVHPARDLFVTSGPADGCDHSVPVRGNGSKVGIDATRKRADENGGRACPRVAEAPAEVARRIQEQWSTFGIDGRSAD